MKKIVTPLVLIVLLISTISTKAQISFFTDKQESLITNENLKRGIVPQKYRTLGLDINAMDAFVKTIPHQDDPGFNRESAPSIFLPMPDGKTAEFKVWGNNTMSAGLRAKFPNIKSFTGQGVTDKTANIMMDWNEHGFFAFILSPVTGNIFIDPYHNLNNKNYISYYRKDFKSDKSLVEEMSTETISNNTSARNNTQCAGGTLLTYRLAVACTGEYARAVGGTNVTINAALAKIVITVNRCNGVYQKESAIAFSLIPDNATIVFTSPSSDPFTGNNNAGTLINESQSVIDNNIGSGGYDIGHTFSTGGGGLAQLGCVCNDASKARGITGSSNPQGDAYDIDFVAHELGHQFRGNHTFNASTVNCSGNGSPQANVEPGSGTTIMAYAGICGAANNLQSNSDPYFHARSQDEIYDFTINSSTGGLCPVSSSTGNTPPVVTVPSSFTIPALTPFLLTGSATDANGDALTYSWEQNNTGSTFGNWDRSPQHANQPLFRSFIPTTSPSRSFPKLTDVLSGGSTMGEVMPESTRNMRFRLTARDNRAGGGGSCYGETTVSVNGAAGPFTVSFPWNFYVGGATQTVTWSVNGTDAFCPNVRIDFSTDGGLTFPHQITASTPNDGSELITIPNIATSQARIRVMGAGNVFYNVNNQDFTVTFNMPVNWLSFTGVKQSNKTTLLSWTVNEQNNKHYEIERSFDGKKFEVIGLINSTIINGEAKYNFVDNAPSKRNMYRIKQVDIDGKSTYSNVIMVSFESFTSKWEVFPNPSNVKTNILSNDNFSNVEISLIDLNGKLVYSTRKANTTRGEIISIPVNNFAKGVYSLKIQTKEGETTVKKVVVQ
ncbi:MAG: reprolysin-like metallopeptidase [Chitinophagaceae bacterium]